MKPVLALVVLLATGLIAGEAVAQKRGAERNESAERERTSESVRKVERETGGDVLRAERRTQDGAEVTRVKVITPQGRVRTVETSRPTETRDEDGDPGED